MIKIFVTVQKEQAIRQIGKKTQPQFEKSLIGEWILNDPTEETKKLSKVPMDYTVEASGIELERIRQRFTNIPCCIPMIVDTPVTWRGPFGQFIVDNIHMLSDM